MLEPPLLWMPVHLLSMVLCQLDNTTSLASAIFSHSSLYAAWMEDRHRIVRTVLRNQIPPAVEPYVFLTHLAGSPDVDHDDLSQLRRFLTRHIYFPFKFTSPPREALFSKSNPVDIRLASSLSRTHAIVEHFTKHFVQDTLPVARKELGLRGKQGATDDEVFRIQRSMYRYQMYCNLFGHPYDRDKRRRLEAPLSVRFFRPYSPWVNEQLAAVHDYFERVLSRGTQVRVRPAPGPHTFFSITTSTNSIAAFDEVAAHDVEWGYKSINWLTVANRNEHKQGYVTLPAPNNAANVSVSNTICSSSSAALISSINSTKPKLIANGASYSATHLRKRDTCSAPCSTSAARIQLG